uniref:Homeobox protein Hox-A10 n=1 Tax=Amazona collaria TaxID=241587 RepID=A0A8B9FYX6_9PSIT
MSCSESPAANSFLVDSLISTGRGEAAGAGGGGGGGGGGYYPNSGIYLPQPSDLSYGLQSCGLFPVLSKRNEGTSQSMVPSSHPYVSGMEVWLDPPRSCRMEEPESQQATSCSFAPKGRGKAPREGRKAPAPQLTLFSNSRACL